jgi:hypothetical protein
VRHAKLERRSLEPLVGSFQVEFRTATQTGWCGRDAAVEPGTDRCSARDGKRVAVPTNDLERRYGASDSDRRVRSNRRPSLDRLARRRGLRLRGLLHVANRRNREEADTGE